MNLSGTSRLSRSSAGILSVLFEGYQLLRKLFWNAGSRSDLAGKFCLGQSQAFGVRINYSQKLSVSISGFRVRAFEGFAGPWFGFSGRGAPPQGFKMSRTVQDAQTLNPK